MDFSVIYDTNLFSYAIKVLYVPNMFSLFCVTCLHEYFDVICGKHLIKLSYVTVGNFLFPSREQLNFCNLSAVLFKLTERLLKLMRSRFTHIFSTLSIQQILGQLTLSNYPPVYCLSSKKLPRLFNPPPPQFRQSEYASILIESKLFRISKLTFLQISMLEIVAFVS